MSRTLTFSLLAAATLSSIATSGSEPAPPDPTQPASAWSVQDYQGLNTTSVTPVNEYDNTIEIGIDAYAVAEIDSANLTVQVYYDTTDPNGSFYGALSGSANDTSQSNVGQFGTSIILTGSNIFSNCSTSSGICWADVDLYAYPTDSEGTIVADISVNVSGYGVAGNPGVYINL